jgi:hypothetical protein
MERRKRCFSGAGCRHERCPERRWVRVLMRFAIHGGTRFTPVPPSASQEFCNGGRLNCRMGCPRRPVHEGWADPGTTSAVSLRACAAGGSSPIAPPFEWEPEGAIHKVFHLSVVIGSATATVAMVARYCGHPARGIAAHEAAEAAPPGIGKSSSDCSSDAGSDADAFEGGQCADVPGASVVPCHGIGQSQLAIPSHRGQEGVAETKGAGGGSAAP